MHCLIKLPLLAAVAVGAVIAGVFDGWRDAGSDHKSAGHTQHDGIKLIQREERL